MPDIIDDQSLSNNSGDVLLYNQQQQQQNHEFLYFEDVPKCYCTWKNCRSWQQTFYDHDHNIFNGVVRIQWKGTDKKETDLKKMWGNELKLGESKRSHDEYFIARHHFPESMILKMLEQEQQQQDSNDGNGDGSSWDWKTTCTKKDADEYYGSLSLPVEEAAAPGDDDLYFKLPNVPKDRVKAIVKEVRAKQKDYHNNNKKNDDDDDAVMLSLPSRPAPTLVPQYNDSSGGSGSFERLDEYFGMPLQIPLYRRPDGGGAEDDNNNNNMMARTTTSLSPPNVRERRMMGRRGQSQRSLSPPRSQLARAGGFSSSRNIYMGSSNRSLNSSHRSLNSPPRRQLSRARGLGSTRNVMGSSDRSLSPPRSQLLSRGPSNRSLSPPRSQLVTARGGGGGGLGISNRSPNAAGGGGGMASSLAPPRRPGMGHTEQDNSNNQRPTIPLAPSRMKSRVSTGLVTLSTQSVKEDLEKQERIKQIEEQQKEDRPNPPQQRSRYGEDDDVPILPSKPAAMRGTVPLSEHRLKRRITSGLNVMNTLSVEEDVNKQEKIRQIEEETEQQQQAPPPHSGITAPLSEQPSMMMMGMNSSNNNNTNDPNVDDDGMALFVPPPLVSRAGRHGEVEDDGGGILEVDEEEYERLMDERDELVEANEEQELTITELQSQIEALREEMSRNVERHEETNDELDEMEEKVELAIADKDDELQSAVYAVRMEMETMKVDYGFKLEDLKKKNEALQAEKDEMESTMKSKLEEGEVKRAEAVTMADRLTKILEESRDSHAEQARQRESEIAQLREAVDRLENDNKALKDETANIVEKSATSRTKEQEEHQSIVMDLKRSILSLTEENQRIKSEKASVEEGRDGHVEQVRQKESEIAQLRETMDRLETENEALVTDLKQTISSLQEENQRISSEKDKVTAQANDLLDDIKAIKEEFKDMQRAAVQREADLTSTLEEAKAREDSLTTELSQRQQDIDDLKDKSTKLQKEFRESKQKDFTTIKELEDKVTQLITDKDMLTNKALQLAGKNAGSMLKIQELEDQIARIEYGSMDRETTLRRVMEKEKSLQQILKKERERQAELTAHMYFAKQSLKQIRKRESEIGGYGAAERRRSSFSRSSIQRRRRSSSSSPEETKNLRPSIIVPSRSSIAKQEQARGNWATLYSVFTSARDEFSLEETGGAILSNTLPEERALEMKMGR